jgi:hypothetical protein
LKSHHSVFPQGQFVAISPDGILVGSAGTLNVSLGPEHVGNIWFGIIADDMFANRHPNIDSLWGASISIHQWYKHEGIGCMLFGARKDHFLRLVLKR